MDESFLEITGGESVAAAFEEFPVKRCGAPIARASSCRLCSGKLTSSSNCSDPLFGPQFKYK